MLTVTAIYSTVLESGSRLRNQTPTVVTSTQTCTNYRKQEDSQKEQVHLLQAVANRYVAVLGTEGMDDYKDFLFKHYPFVIANAIVWGFHYLCPGSRHLYSNAFKRVLYLQCARILSGVEVREEARVVVYGGIEGAARGW